MSVRDFWAAYRLRLPTELPALFVDESMKYFGISDMDPSWSETQRRMHAMASIPPAEQIFRYDVEFDENLAARARRRGLLMLIPTERLDEQTKRPMDRSTCELYVFFTLNGELLTRIVGQVPASRWIDFDGEGALLLHAIKNNPVNCHGQSFRL
jgi:hypothetical protein